MSKALVPLAPGCEELEAVTIIDILRRAGIEVVVAGLAGLLVKASRGVVLQADVLLPEALKREDIDMVVIPGGMGGTQALAGNGPFLNWLKAMNQACKWIAAICAAPLVLDKAGILVERHYTAYPGVLNAAQSRHAAYTGAAVEVDGNLVTSRGPGTAMDFALALVQVLKGEEMRVKVEQELVRQAE